MKRTNKAVFIVSIVAMLLLASGCGNNRNISPDNTTNINDDRVISISTLKEDIAGDPTIQSCFTSDLVNDSAYLVVKLSIVKEQINEKDIVTYSEIVLENLFFSVKLQVKTIYNFYEYGGWIMEDLQIEEVIEIIPICGPDPNCVDEYITQTGIQEVLYQDTRSTISDEFDISVSETVLVNGTTAHASAQVQTDVARFDGYFVFTLTENGWVFGEKWGTFHVTDYTADYTSRLGHFIIDNDMYYDLEMEEYIIFDSFDIEILSIEGTTVTYNLNSCSMRTFDYSVETGQQQTAFDPFSGKFSIGTYDNALGTNPMLVCYDRYSNGWDVIESSLKKSPQ